jgi:prephenate dehydrogenase
MTNSPPPLPFRRVGIVGLGLVGGSIARGLSALASPPEILASATDAAELERAVAEGVVQRPSTPERIAATADLVVYATPPRATLAYLETHGDLWRRQAVVTDVGGAKRALVRRARELGLRERYVGADPVLHDPARGYAAARADLFAGTRVWITPVDEREGTPASAVESLWRALGAQPMRIDAERHDRLVAWTAYLPRLAATALGAALAASGFGADALEGAARAATEQAGGSAASWEEILATSGDLLEDPLMALEGSLGKLLDAVRARDLDAIARLLDGAGQWRRA